MASFSRLLGASWLLRGAELLHPNFINISLQK